MTIQKPTLYCTCGIPRSGKSTWAKSTGWPIVEADAVRLALHNQPFIGDAEPMVWTMVRYFVKSLFLAGHENVILSSCCHTKYRQNEWISKLWDTKYVVFDTPKSECISRALANDQEYLVDVINRMDREFEMPIADAIYEIHHWES